MGHADPFGMGQGYRAALGVRRFLSGTPPILGMVSVRAGVEQLERAGIAAVRAKSILQTQFAVDLADDLLAPHGVEVATPRDPAARGGHITLRRHDFRQVTDVLWATGVVPDFRAPDGIRLGIAPLSTSFREVLDGILALEQIVRRSA
jgi:kynureninase